MRFLFTILAAAAFSLAMGCTSDLAPEPASSSSSSTVEEPTVQLVSLSVPNMTCNGCAASVRGTLTGIEGVVADSIEFDMDAKTCNFKTTNQDIESLLTTAAESVNPMKGFTVQ